MSIYGAETAIEDIFNGIRPRVHVNIGKPFGPFKIRGKRKKRQAFTRNRQGYDDKNCSAFARRKTGPFFKNQISKTPG